MRVLLTYYKRSGHGSARSVQYLAEGLGARGHEVLVATPGEGVLAARLASSAAPGVEVVPFGFGRGWSPDRARALAELVRARGIEVVDAQESRDRKAAILARRLFRMPGRLVITRRQESASFFLENVIYGLAADRVIAISHGVARSLVRRGMPRRRIAVVHTGTDPRRMEAEVPAEELSALGEALGLDPALPTVGVVARRKDQEALLRAAAVLGRPLNLLFIGIGRDEALAALEPALPPGSRVAYTGFREDVLPLWRLLDVKVLPTRSEALSQAILEAMAAGVPVVSAAVGGTPEVVEDGRNGLLFPPGDAAALASALARLLDDRALARRLADAARETVRGRFHLRELARATEAVYQDVLAGGGTMRGPR